MKHISLEGLWNKGRKTGIILFAFVMLVSITACGQTETSKESTIESQETEPAAIPVSEDVGSVNEVSEAFAESGDIALYSGNHIVVFYGSNSWAYTRLGKVTDKSKKEMADLLGNGDVTITISVE